MLLYIGVTNGVPFRWNGHQAVQPWWDELRSLTVEWYPSREEALAAEKAAILAEQPKYNVTHLKPSGSGRKLPHAGQPPADLPAVVLDPRADDEDLLSIDDIGRMLRTTPGSAQRTLSKHGGPPGFRMGTQRVYRKGEIRRWIAAIEASQRDSRGIA
ncbi:MAG TPA: hypothetical protein VKU77_32105 [Streptosporangiaceae bacterium]|nr:hypothetical protein [Streptosporangiaceae bacterium]